MATIATANQKLFIFKVGVDLWSQNMRQVRRYGVILLFFWNSCADDFVKKVAVMIFYTLGLLASITNKTTTTTRTSKQNGIDHGKQYWKTEVEFVIDTRCNVIFSANKIKRKTQLESSFSTSNIETLLHSPPPNFLCIICCKCPAFCLK